VPEDGHEGIEYGLGRGNRMPGGVRSRHAVGHELLLQDLKVGRFGEDVDRSSRLESGYELGYSLGVAEARVVELGQVLFTRHRGQRGLGALQINISRVLITDPLLKESPSRNLKNDNKKSVQHAGKNRLLILFGLSL
jgi:hypothetical protein